jgi:hypothetical protein
MSGRSGKLLLIFVSTVILGSECHGILDYILLSHDSEISATISCGQAMSFPVQYGPENCCLYSSPKSFLVLIPRDSWPYFAVSWLTDRTTNFSTITAIYTQTQEIKFCQRKIVGKCTIKNVIIHLQNWKQDWKRNGKHAKQKMLACL